MNKKGNTLRGLDEVFIVTLRDSDIRSGLKAMLVNTFIGTDTIIVDELRICWGDTRIDVAVVNCSLHGYEIKSDRDTLERLPRQVKLYDKIFDTITLVCSHRLVSKARRIISPWWGIQIPLPDSTSPTGVRFEVEREADLNQQVDLRSLIELTWKQEAIGILEKYGLDRGFRNRPRWDIWDRIVENIDADDVKRAVRECLKGRQGWRTPETLHRLCVD